jgi:anti-anti-sigma regulatory factor
MRGPAQRLRERVLLRLAQQTAPVRIDFEGVASASSSFLDELLGRLANQLGLTAFRQRIRVTGLSETLSRMANVVINQRLHGLGSERDESEAPGALE